MALFGRRRAGERRDDRKPDDRLPEDQPRPAGLSAEPPGWDGEPRGEPGIHGIPRPRRWDAVVSASAPGLHGDSLEFVALADGTILVDGEAANEGARPLADAVRPMLAAPFRAQARRQDSEIWAVGASSIAVVSQASLAGDEVELVVTREGRALHIDGRPSFAPAAALEEAGLREGEEYVVRAGRLAGDLWEVEATAL